MVLVNARESQKGPWMQVNGKRLLSLNIHGLEEDGKIKVQTEMSNGGVVLCRVGNTQFNYKIPEDARRWCVEKVSGQKPLVTTVLARLG
jgi:hypothetical protein